MKHLTLITLLFLSITMYGQSKMDMVEKEMQTEYQLHDIQALTRYMIINHSKLVNKDEFKLNNRLYKVKVKDSRKAESDDGTVTYYVKHMHREYVYKMNDGSIQLYSDNFATINLIEYNHEKQEVKFLQRNDEGSEFKLYGFVYDYSGNTIEDWVVRDADGRANSMGKVYYKRK